MRVPRVLSNICLFSSIFILISCDYRYSDKEVHVASRDISELPAINIQSPSKFLNDLKLSPLWKVEKNREGNITAYARSISSSDPFLEPNPNKFLFEFLETENPLLPENYTLHNRYVQKNDSFNSLSAKIVFQKPSDPKITICEGEEKVNLSIYESYEKQIGPNSWSKLAIQLDKKREIYLILEENGRDHHRKATFEKLSTVLAHIKEISKLPTQYHTGEYYRKFYTLFFPDSHQETEVQRFPGIQGIDTFYGYFKSKEGLSYEGINVKISHPIYCEGECTSIRDRLEKAEYLGIPYYQNDKLFFLIENNLTSVLGEYRTDYGWASGNKSFEGDLEIFNDQGHVLYKGKDRFTGWER